jgi:pilus assembly protein Flp/PilA
LSRISELQGNLDRFFYLASNLLIGGTNLNIPVVGDAATCPAGQKIKRRRLLMTNIKTMIGKFMKEEDGATAIEYGIMIALISAGLVATVALIGGHLATAFQTVEAELAP